MEYGNVRFVNCCCNGRSIRPHRCATFAKRCTTMPSNQPSAAATVRKSHARALHAHASSLACAWNAERASVALRYCLGAA
eukprot:11188164-Lingulodinium_polyedra.AAC.1